jgi:hypothetical protein
MDSARDIIGQMTVWVAVAFLASACVARALIAGATLLHGGLAAAV